MLYKIILCLGCIIALLSIIDIEILPLKTKIEYLDGYHQKNRKRSTYLVLETTNNNQYIIPDRLDGLIVDSNIILSNRTFLFNWKKSITYRLKNNEFTLLTGISLDEYLLKWSILFWCISLLALILFYNKTKSKYQYLYERFIGLGFVFLLFLFISFFIAY